MRTCAVFLMAAVAAGGALAQPLEFKGVPFGAGPDQLRELPSIHTWLCSEQSNNPLGDYLCDIGDTTYAQREAKNGRAYFFGADGARRLGSIRLSVDSADFSDIREAIASKYGRPTNEAKSKVTSKAGAAYDQVVTTWATKDRGTITLTRYGRSVLNGTLDISSAEYLAEFAKRNASYPKPKDDI